MHNASRRDLALQKDAELGPGLQHLTFGPERDAAREIVADVPISK